MKFSQFQRNAAAGMNGIIWRVVLSNMLSFRKKKKRPPQKKTPYVIDFSQRKVKQCFILFYFLTLMLTGINESLATDAVL